MTKKILVTGGAGFIGSNLTDELTKQGNEVVIIDDLSSGKKEYINKQAKFYEIDICSDGINKIFKDENFDYVFHLAAQMDVRKSVADPIFDNRVNVVGGFNILENCRKTGVAKIVFTSTGGAVYGDAGEIPTTESYLPHPVSPYGIHKLTFEKYLHYYRELYGTVYTALRLANIYGPRQFKGGEAGVVSIFIDHAVNGKKCIINGDGKQTRDYVYVGDVVAALIKAVDADYNGCINIATSRETDILRIVEYIEKAMGHAIDKEHGPAMPGEQIRSCLAIGRAREILDWEPTVDLEKGIRKTIEWARSCNT